MNLLEMIVEWYKMYETPFVFAYHKLTHVGVGCLVGYVGASAGFPALGQVLVLALGIAKEVHDHAASYDVMSEKNGEDPYQYDAPMYAHVFDVIVTQLGGFLGYFLFRMF